MTIRLNEHLTYKKIFLVTILPIIMCVFSSIYGVVDGFCVSFYCGKDSFAGVNLIFPIISVIGTLGFMFASGGVALVGKYLGQGKTERAHNAFSLIVIVQFVVGVIFSIIAFFFVEPLARAVASVSPDNNEEVIKQAIQYGRVMILGQPFFMTQCVLTIFLNLDEKPKGGFIATLLAGFTNMGLDFLFVGAFKWGNLGAAAASIIGFIVGSIMGFYFLASDKTAILKFVKPKMNWKDLWKTCFNGISEFATNVSASVISIIFNLQLLKFYSMDGVIAYGAIMYITLIFSSVFFGYGGGISPFIAYNYGERNVLETRSLLNKSLIITLISGFLMFGIGFLLSNPLGLIFSSGDSNVADLTAHACRIFSVSFIFAGFNVFMSGFFTALNNGKVSAIIALLRSFVFQIAFLYLLPNAMNSGEGIWLSIIGAEFFSAILSFAFLFKKNEKYHYLKTRSDFIEE